MSTAVGLLTSLNYVCDMSVIPRVWVCPCPPSSLLLSVPATVPSACLLTSPGPRPSRPLPSWPPPATHSRTIVIISSQWVSYLHHHKMPGLDVNILKECVLHIDITFIPLLRAVIHYEMRNRMKYGIRYTGSQQGECCNNSWWIILLWSFPLW